MAMVSFETATRWIPTGTDGLDGSTSTIPGVSRIPLPRRSRWIPRRVNEWGGVILSPRVLVLGFLMIAAFLTTRSWLRPPLSGDVPALCLPVNPVDPDSGLPEQLLHGSRRIRIESIGTLMLAAMLPGVIVAAWQPRPDACGRRPAAERPVGRQCGRRAELSRPDRAARHRVRAMAADGRDAGSGATRQCAHRLVNRSSRRRSRARWPGQHAPAECQERASLFRGWIYLKYGSWLVPWAALGLLFWSRGSLGSRLGRVGLYLALGVALAGLVCERRLRAEAQWEVASAWRLVATSRPPAALDRALALFPEFERLERTWLLVGKLDLHQGWDTPQAEFYRATIGMPTTPGSAPSRA